MNDKPKQLSPRLTSHLLAYATAAGAIAASTSLAQAEVVYTPIDRNVRSRFFIDLNHDGLEDFQIYSSLLSGAGIVDVFPAQNNRVLAAGPGECQFENAAAPLPGGAVIGPGKPFQASANCMAYLGYGGPSGGPWMEVKDRYLGFAFVINGKEHFGWARLSLSKFLFNNTAKIEGYAYETIANKPIIAGDEGSSSEVSAPSGTLGKLALGASTKSAAKEKE